MKNLIFQKYRPLIIILTCFFVVRLFFLLTRYHHPIWDESVYLGMGKYLYSSGQSGLWEALRPLGLPLVLGFFWKIGLNYLLLAQLLALTFSSLSIIIVYLVALEAYDKRTAILSSILFASFPVFFLYSGYTLSEIPSTFFASLAIYLMMKQKFFFSGLAAGISFLFRFPQGLILIVLVLFSGYRLTYSYFKDRKSLKMALLAPMLLAIGFALAVTPFFAFNYEIYHEFTKDAKDAILRPLIIASYSQVIETDVPLNVQGINLYSLFFYLIEIIKRNFFLLFCLFAIYLHLKNRKSVNENKTLLMLSLLIYFGYHTAINNKQERFLIQFLPYLAILSSYGFLALVKNSKPFARKMLRIVLIISLVLALIFDLSYYFYWADNSNIPKHIEGYYGFFESNKIDGAIVTTDPVFAAYSDNIFIPVYFMQKNEISYVNEWEQVLDIKAIAFSPSAFPCLESDLACIKERDGFNNYLQQNFQKIYNTSFDGEEHNIFISNIR